MSERSRRSRSEKSGRSAALERLKNMKSKGELNKAQIGEEVDGVFEEVTEDEYAEMVRGRQEEDWIVDDDGSGYVEDGREIFDEDGGKKDKVQGGSKEKKNFKPKNRNVMDPKHRSSIKGFFGKASKKKLATEPTKKDEVKDEELLDEMLDVLDNDDEDGPSLQASSASSSRAPLVLSKPQMKACAPRRKNPFCKTPIEDDLDADGLMDSLVGEETEDQDLMGGGGEPPCKQIRRQDPPSSASLRLSTEADPSTKLASIKTEVDVDYDNELNDDAPPPMNVDSEAVVIKSELAIKQEEVPKTAEAADEITTKKPVSLQNWSFVGDNNENGEGVVITKEEDERVKVETDDESSLNVYTNDRGQRAIDIFWFDAYQDAMKQPGKAYLFGRCQPNPAANPNVWASVCVTVSNLERVLYFLPKGKGETMTELNEEVQSILFKNSISQFRVRKVTMKTALFGLEIPKESEYLEVRYKAATGTTLPHDLSGRTFSHVFGTSNSSLENLLLECNLRGPGWISIVEPKFPKACVSWCQLEIDCDNPSGITVAKEQAPSPTFRTVSLQLLTLPNKANADAVVGISLLFSDKYDMDQPPTATNQRRTQCCIVTKPPDGSMPYDLKQIIEQKGGRGIVEIAGNERALLNLTLLRIQKFDPDIIIGHDMLGYGLELLINRFNVCKVPNWSRISRLRRSQQHPPRLSGSKQALLDVLAGRVLLDSHAIAKELVRARAYDLCSLSQQILGVERVELMIEDMLPMYRNGTKLVELIGWLMEGADLSFRISVKLNALPLFVHITKIVGGIMSRTLMGGRAERNEYLLLHAFYDQKYILPNKQTFFNKKSAQLPPAQDNRDPQDVGGGEDSKNSKKKGPSYSGGLVLEPKKGLYDKFVLLLDFNSLYPSIIQEYNICLTTVSCPKGGVDDIPSVPEPSLPEGILPQQIKKLVDSRREVKQLMKKPNLDPHKYGQYNIRQLALKLTANSMYGCLGFSFSRFYAKPLAALITSKGREILMHTKDLVEKRGYEVIYGDTDSIMIHTNCLEYSKVMAVGKEIKSEVNKEYRLLELDIDGVYKSLLLLKKKKYAGLSVESVDPASGQLTLKREMKGLDIVRRDWSQIAKDAGIETVDQILSGKSCEDILESIHEHLYQLADRIKEGKIEIDKFEISKSLTRNPKEYADKKGQAHVSVALRLNEKGGSWHYKQGDTVHYIICTDGTNNSAVERAYHQSELKDNPTKLKIDTVYYLAQQIHPVVSRLCSPVEGTDAGRIAEALGLDPAGYRNSAGPSEEFLSEENADRLDDDWSTAVPLKIPCPRSTCSNVFEIEGPTYKPKGKILDWKLKEACPTCADEFKLSHSNVYVCNQLDRNIMEMMDQFYQMTDAQLFTQLSFYHYLFNYQKTVERYDKDSEKKNELLEGLKQDDGFRVLMDDCRRTIEEYLDQNAYSQVDLGHLFQYLQPPATTKSIS